ncbi:MAG: protein kinase [Elusimicrobia bacterium]|nr:protein kinase [Elusimicrobiota bacterium]
MNPFAALLGLVLCAFMPAGAEGPDPPSKKPAQSTRAPLSAQEREKTQKQLLAQAFEKYPMLQKAFSDAGLNNVPIDVQLAAVSIAQGVLGKNFSPEDIRDMDAGKIVPMVGKSQAEAAKKALSDLLAKLSEAQAAANAANQQEDTTGTDPSGQGQDPRARPKPHPDPGAGLADALQNIDPNSPAIQSGVGRIHIQQGNNQAGFDAMNRAIALGGANWRNYYYRGLAADRVGDHEQAHRDAEISLQFNPRSLEAKTLYHLTEGKISRVHLNTSTSGLQPSLDDNVDRTEARGVLPDLPSPARLASRAQTDAAPGAANPAAAAYGLVVDAQRALRLKDPVNATVLAAKAIVLDRNNATAYHVKSIAESQRGRYVEALQDANASLSLLAPEKNPQALEARSWAHNGLKRYADALKDAQAARSLRPSDGFAWVNEARALGGLGRRAEMLERLREAARMEPEMYGKTYQEAVQLPEYADTETLFGGAQASAPRPEAARGSKAWHLVLYSLFGGVLIALGLLHIGSRAREATTARSASAGPAAGASAFWSLYRDRKELAKGGMGVVYEAVDSALGRRVAIKRMRDEIRADPHERERFLKEARTVASLKHPGIVQIFQVAEDGPDIYLVFEHVEGETLADKLKREKTFGLPAALSILREVCAAVEHAHGKDLMHRDLKPPNIMIDREGRVKVMDFGIARQAEDAMAKLAMTNTVAGTPPYMAPEQEQGLVCKQSDIFALGVLAYQMLGVPGRARGARRADQECLGGSSCLDQKPFCASRRSSSFRSRRPAPTNGRGTLTTLATGGRSAAGAEKAIAAAWRRSASSSAAASTPSGRAAGSTPPGPGTG